jgi:hypothetical protein
MSTPMNHQASRLARITASRDGTPEIAEKERLVDTAHLVSAVCFTGGRLSQSFILS